MKEVINCRKLPKSLNSHAVKYGSLLYTSGIVGRDPRTGELAEGIQQQAQQALENLKTLLEFAGTSIDNVIKITIFVKNLQDVPKLNEIYYKVFSENRPARTCIEVSNIAMGALLELEAIACIE